MRATSTAPPTPLRTLVGGVLVGLQTQCLGEVVEGAGGENGQRQVVVERDSGDRGAGTVAAGHPEGDDVGPDDGVQLLRTVLRVPLEDAGLRQQLRDVLAGVLRRAAGPVDDDGEAGPVGQRGQVSVQQLGRPVLLDLPERAHQQRGGDADSRADDDIGLVVHTDVDAGVGDGGGDRRQGKPGDGEFEGGTGRERRRGRGVPARERRRPRPLTDAAGQLGAFQVGAPPADQRLDQRVRDERGHRERAEPADPGPPVGATGERTGHGQAHPQPTVVGRAGEHPQRHVHRLRTSAGPR